VENPWNLFLARSQRKHHVNLHGLKPNDPIFADQADVDSVFGIRIDGPMSDRPHYCPAGCALFPQNDAMVDAARRSGTLLIQEDRSDA
jgi:hypothetical protein